MCCNPITIKNPSRKYRSGIDKMYYKVPCGHCKECLKKEQEDWFVRSFFEFKRIQSLGGSIFFPTLTYDNDNVPQYSDELRGFSCPCFNAEHLKRFRDRLRVYLVRFFNKKILDEHFTYKSTFVKKTGVTHYYYSRNDKKIALSKAKIFVKSLRFIIVPEFGSRVGRPHYHVLLFCPFNISDRDMLQILRKSWKYGFVGVSHKGLRIMSVSALQYCMKYVSKEQHWTKYYGVYDYLAQLREEIKNGRVESEFDLKAFKKCLPHHRQSLHYGFDIIPSLMQIDDILVKGEIDLSQFGFVVGKRFTFGLPRYISRLILQTKDNFGLVYPSERYFSIMKKLFDYQITQLEHSFLPFRTYENFCAFAKQIELDVTDREMCWNTLQLVKDSHRNMCIYNLVLRDVSQSFFKQSKFNINDLYVIAFDFLFKQKDNKIIPEPENKPLCKTKPFLFDKSKVHTFNDFPILQDYERALQIIEMLNGMINKDESSCWFESEEISVNTYRHDTTEYFVSL